MSDTQEEDKLIKVRFVKTKENVSDIGTKNVDTATHKAHESEMIKDGDDSEDHTSDSEGC